MTKESIFIVFYRFIMIFFIFIKLNRTIKNESETFFILYSIKLKNESKRGK